jgi:LPS-assembly protein
MPVVLARLFRSRGLLLTAALLWTVPANAAEATRDPLCVGVFPEIPVIPPRSDDKTHLQADEARVSRESVSTFIGEVVIQRDAIQMEADRAEYLARNDTLDAEGNVRFIGSGLLITGTDAHADLRNNRASFNNARYFSVERANGRAASIRLLDPDHLELTDATFTTCNPDDPDWQLSADRVKLDRSTRQGKAYGVVMAFKNVPFLYLPYLRFPIGDERLSGFLFPRIGNSDLLGGQLQLPYYWNIAPNYDATITPWHMSERGTMLQTEFRYLHSHNQGQFDAQYLPADKGRADEERERFRWQHQGQPGGGRWRTRVDYNYVSDSDFLRDFGNTLDTTSTTHLDQMGSLTYVAPHWQFRSVAQGFQTLLGDSPYERLPQLLFETRRPERSGRLNYSLRGEWVRFDHPDPARIQGTRLDLKPVISWPLRSSAGFLVPQIAWRYTAYELDNPATGSDATPSREIPIYSLDSGLVFERSTRFGTTAYIQTLEPRLYYVYAPFRDQDNLPVFDTQLSRFNVNEPFKADFFDGADRVEDANRLTAMLTTRLLEEQTGKERFSAGIGQVFYFDDRRVILPGDSIQTERRSNVIAQVRGRPNARWDLYADAEWNPPRQEFDKTTARIAYRRHPRFELDLAYRFERNVLETTESRFRWRLNPRWQLSGRRLYDLLNQRNQESELGLRYDSCCWAVKLLSRERFISDSVKTDNSIVLELELKGLASPASGG